MSSREIAELVEKRHDNVKRTIETLAERGVITLPQIEETSFKGADGRGQTVTEYVFKGEQGKRDSYVVVAQLSPQFTARLVDRWQELEGKLAVSLPQDPVLRSIVISMQELDKVRTEQQAQRERLTRIESLIPTAATHMTILAYFASRGSYLNTSQANAFGRVAAARTRMEGLIINPVPDDRYGTVNSYPLSILSEIYEEFRTAAEPA